VDLLILNCVIISFGLEGGGGAIGAPLRPLDLLINVTMQPFMGRFECYPSSLDLKCPKRCSVEIGLVNLIVDGYDPI
jgi:hypothetical protein